jgi:hypothetical protein
MAHELEREVRRRFVAPMNDVPPPLPKVRLLAELPRTQEPRGKPW